MKKVLFTATIDGHIRIFHQPYLEWFKLNNYEVHVASSGIETFKNCDVKHNIAFQRFPLSRANWRAYKELKTIIDSNNFDIIHCHTPTAGVLTRLAAIKARKNNTKVIYTAHGFHFYKGAKIKNWLLYFLVEYFLSLITDCLITINQEDFKNAKKYLKASKIKYVHGVGVDLSKYNPPINDEKNCLRKELKLSEDAFILVYPAECSYRKNQIMLLEVINILKDEIPNISLLLAGRGDFEKFNKYIEENQLDKHVTFLGFRYDIDKFIRCSDVGISSSRQEGLPINVLEAMASGKPMVVTDVRGNNDLVTNNENGFLVTINDKVEMANKLKLIYKNNKQFEYMGENSFQKAKIFSLNVALNETISLYKDIVNSN
jgi:glycosyltransferase EpsD